MGGLNKTTKRLTNWVKGKGFKTSKEIKKKKEIKQQSKLDEIYANAEVPDEEAIRRNERRKAAGRRGSRTRNVLTETDDDALG